MKSRLSTESGLFKKPIAHRGLWGETSRGFIAENSIAAYEAAAERGIPIETDLYLSTDGVLYCFHDATLERTTNGSGFIYEKNSMQLDALSLNGCSGEKIPRLSELLEISCGKSSLLIELKNQPVKGFTEAAVKALSEYKGEFAVQSFVPAYLLKVKKLAPDFLRGVLGTENAQGKNAAVRFTLKNMPFNRLIEPDFISYRHTGLPLAQKKRGGLPVFAWTITSESEEVKAKEFADNVIFEGFVPQEYKSDKEL